MRKRARRKAEGEEGAWIIDNAKVEEILGAPRYAMEEAEKEPEIGVVTGLAWTSTGGDLMLIEDHLNLTGDNPLMGANDGRFGARFPDMSEAYDKGLTALADEVATARGLRLKRGVYAGLLGPSYETPAEIRFYASVGDIVGMTVAAECVLAAELQLAYAAVCMVDNLANGVGDDQLTVEEFQQGVETNRSRFATDVGAVARSLTEA